FIEFPESLHCAQALDCGERLGKLRLRVELKLMLLESKFRLRLLQLQPRHVQSFVAFAAQLDRVQIRDPEAALSFSATTSISRLVIVDRGVRSQACLNNSSLPNDDVLARGQQIAVTLRCDLDQVFDAIATLLIDILRGNRRRQHVEGNRMSRGLCLRCAELSLISRRRDRLRGLGHRLSVGYLCVQSAVCGEQPRSTQTRYEDAPDMAFNLHRYASDPTCRWASFGTSD